jgi:hypothetical protein
MADLKKVPVTFDGFEIGDAILSKDGQVVMIKLNDTPVGMEFRETLCALRGGSVSIRTKSDNRK